MPWETQLHRATGGCLRNVPNASTQRLTAQHQCLSPTPQPNASARCFSPTAPALPQQPWPHGPDPAPRPQPAPPEMGTAGPPCPLAGREEAQPGTAAARLTAAVPAALPEGRGQGDQGDWDAPLRPGLVLTFCG